MTKLLLVEDDFALRDIYSARFMAEGFEVATASDGEEALAVAVREKPNLIILDVMMPKISGFDVLDILRQTPETKETQVIMMTALSQETDRQRGETLGVDRYLVKSQVTLDDVVNTVQQVIGSAGPDVAAATTPPPDPSTASPSDDAPAAAPADAAPSGEAPAPPSSPATPGTIISPQSPNQPGS